MHARVVLGNMTFAVVMLWSCRASAADRPNILWLTAEDMSPHLGCYGDAEARSPRIDAFAREAVRYTHAFATAKRSAVRLTAAEASHIPRYVVGADKLAARASTTQAMASQAPNRANIRFMPQG